jgi:hypothetical protein
MADSFQIALPELRMLDIKTSEAFGAYSRRIYRLPGLCLQMLPPMSGFGEYC